MVEPPISQSIKSGLCLFPSTKFNVDPSIVVRVVGSISGRPIEYHVVDSSIVGALPWKSSFDVVGWMFLTFSTLPSLLAS